MEPVRVSFQNVWSQLISKTHHERTLKLRSRLLFHDAAIFPNNDRQAKPTMLGTQLAGGPVVGAEGHLPVLGKFVELQGPERLVLRGDHGSCRNQSTSEIAWDDELAKARGGKPWASQKNHSSASGR